DLGSIDGVFLPEFWQGIDAALVPLLRKPLWERLSIRARIDFWERAKPRLDRLVNRLGPDEFKRPRMLIPARVPWPKEPERTRLALREAEADLKWACRGYETNTKLIALHEKTIAEANDCIASLKKVAYYEVREVVAARDRVTQLQAQQRREE